MLGVSKCLTRAGRQQESGIYVVTLDEMNLSHVEHYFSGFLQALEHSREIRSFDASSVSPDSTFAQYARLVIPKSIRFIGTVNFDETTKQLSLRHLDRTNLVRLRPMEQTAIFPALTDQRPQFPGHRYVCTTFVSGAGLRLLIAMSPNSGTAFNRASQVSAHPSRRVAAKPFKNSWQALRPICSLRFRRSTCRFVSGS